MLKSSNIRIVAVRSGFRQIDLRTPIKFGGRVTTALTLFDAEVDVETHNGLRGTGHGSMPLGNAWAWPGGELDQTATLSAMRKFGELSVSAAAQYKGYGHPLEIADDLQHEYEQLATQSAKAAGLVTPMPKLAQLNAASPIDAAVHDAFGKALQRNSYDLLGKEFVSRDLSTYLSGEFSNEYLDFYTLRQPKPRMPLYHLIGALDPLSAGDVSSPANDGLPETLGEWIKTDGLTHLKIKLNGNDLRWDLDRVDAVNQVVMQTDSSTQESKWNYSLDFNERCPNCQYLLDFLNQLKERSTIAFKRIQYIEQPTDRDLKSHPENLMHEVAMIKPIVIDESLIDFESLLLAREIGYSGVALKTCKGHSKSLLMAAAAQKFNMFLCVQDLTCPGLSFLHSVTLAARIPRVTTIEGNAREYCPTGNQALAKQYPSVFKPTNGLVESGLLDGHGLGF